MKDKNIEKNIVDDFDEDEFMLNTKSEDFFIEDDTVDTFSEKDYLDELELIEDLDEPIKEVIEEVKEELPTREEHRNKKNKKNGKKEKVHKEKKVKEKKKKEPKEKKKSNGFKVPKEGKKRTIYFIQLVFNLISILFVLGCCIYYGSRMIKYYKIYHPKSETGEVVSLIASDIKGKVVYQTEGEGTYMVYGSVVYKGENVDNYFKYSGYMWRIVTINKDGSIELVLDEPINILSYDAINKEYNSSKIKTYLNKKFLTNIETKYLAKTSYCLDKYEDVPVVNCSNYASDEYVRLLSITEFVNSAIEDKTYLSNVDNFWLLESNASSSWYANGTGISSINANENLYVRPVIRIANTNVLLGGSGTKDDPYYIEENNNIHVGSYVKLGEDTWVVYDINDNKLSLALSSNLSKSYVFSYNKNEYDVKESSSLAYYLNNTYYNSLTYKDKILENNWNIGAYSGDYESVTDKIVSAKVGLLNVADLKINLLNDSYYLLTPAKEYYTYYVDDALLSSKVWLTRGVRPAIVILTDKVSSGDGTKENPFVLGGAE